MKILILLTCLLLPIPAFAGTAIVTLGWEYQTAVSDLAGFKIYQAGASGQYDLTKPALVVSDPAARQGTLPSALSDGTYYWAIAAFDKAGNQSGLSAELKYDLDATAPPVPGALKVVTTVTVTVGQ